MTGSSATRAGSYGRLKNRVHLVLSGGAADHVGRIVSFGLIGLILLNVLAVMAESMAEIKSSYGNWLIWFEAISVAVFVMEYMLRIWSSTVNPLYSHRVTGRIRFVLTPMALIDLLAVLPSVLFWAGVDLRFLRVVRMARLIRLGKLGRYSNALQFMWLAVRSRRDELVMALMLMVLILVLASSLMYMAENERQPEAFSSIPATMWWGIMTLTTVGYGDVYPVTALGKLTAAVIAVVGIGLFALPAGIVGSAFIELRGREMAKHQEACPHCGKPLIGYSDSEDCKK
ncbi:MAG: ion transporter [Thiobacillus sp.]